ADPRTYAAAFRGEDAAFVLWPPGVGMPRERLLPALEVARAEGVERFVLLSVLGAGTLRFLPHVQVERWLIDSGVAYTILRAGYFMQNLSTVHRQDLAEHAEVFIPAGRGHLALVDTRDVAAVAAAALLDGRHGGRIYELTGGASLDFYEVAATFSAALGRPITYRAPSLVKFARRWRARGLEASMIAFMLIEYAITRLDRSGRRTDAVEEVLGRPPIALRQFIEDHRDVWAPA
ncbi:MAG: NmrA family NAD(P)-binding protein, partial [Myxococcales bacterium]|nr:NmrA family NAD(P)-binding protein [Myxococcales bacterium]